MPTLFYTFSHHVVPLRIGFERIFKIRLCGYCAINSRFVHHMVVLRILLRILSKAYLRDSYCGSRPTYHYIDINGQVQQSGKISIKLW